MGKVPHHTHSNSRDQSSRIQSGITSFHSETESPESLGPPTTVRSFHELGSSMKCHLPTGPHRFEVGAPSALDPSPPPRRSMLSPGSPQHSTGAPPAPARARPLRAARLGPASAQPAPPGPDQPPPGPSGRCAPNGGGVRGASPPRGADTRKQPTSRVPARAHAGAARWRSESLPEWPSDCVCVRRLVRLETRRAGHQLPLPEPEGWRQLVIVPAQRAKARRPPLPLGSSKRSFPPQSPASPSKGRPRGSAIPLRLPAPGHKLRDWLGRCLSHPQQAGGHTLGFSEAAPPGGPFQQLTSPPSPPKIPLPFQRSASGRGPRLVPGMAPGSPAEPRGSFAMRKVSAPRGGVPGPQ